MYNELSIKYPHSISEMEKIYSSPEFLNSTINVDFIKKECEGNEILEKLFNDMLNYLYRYTETVFEYNEILSNDISQDTINQKLKELEEIRKKVHNATIDSINILSRQLAKFGKDNSWIDQVGSSRATYGNFAIVNTFRKLLKEKEEEQ